MTHSKLTVMAGERTESLLGAILDQIDNHTLDQLEVERQVPKQSGLAAEPATVAATMIAAVPVLITVLRIVKTYLEGRQVIQRAKLVLQAHERGGTELADLVEEIVQNAPPGWSVEFGALEVEVRHPS